MINLGLLFGGRSSEHDISIISAYQVYEAIKDEYNIFMLYLDKENNMFLANDVSLNNFKRNKLKKLKPISFIKGGISYKKTKLDSTIILNHGINGEDGMSSALLNFYNIAYVGSDIFGSSISLDKANTYYILNNFLIPMTKKQVIYSSDDLIKFDKFIIKPSRLGSSIGISVCNKDNYLTNLEEAFLFDDKVVVEEFLEDFTEYNIALYKTDKIHTSSVFEVYKPKDILSFDDKYINRFKVNRNKVVSDIEIERQIKYLSSYIYDILELEGIVRMDFMYCNNLIYFNEVNVIPGGLSMYFFDSFNKILKELINQSIIKKQVKHQYLRHFDINILSGIKK